MNHRRKAKIVATLGPASSDRDTIRRLHQAGADLFRINMSHASHDTMQALIGHIRAVEADCGKPIGILVDLQGPKLRVGRFRDRRVGLAPGQVFVLDDDEALGDAQRVRLPHPEILDAVRPGHRLLIDDGRLALRVEAATGQKITCRVVSGTEISDRKGVSLPDTLLDVGAMTVKDRGDALAAVATGAVDWIALSFVQRPDDLIALRALVGDRVGIMAKIEKPQALDCLDQIVAQCDAIMVARGDLGVEMPLEAVPGIQKQLTRVARRAGKPVVVATQMLETMISAPVPTRAEVSDVSIAVFEGADALMLSAESASGNYPVEAVATMAAIIRKVEQDPLYPGILSAQRAQPEVTSTDAISLAARQIAETLGLAAIIAYSSTGATGLRAARERPEVPILALSPSIQTARRLTLCWGTECVVASDAQSLPQMVERAVAVAIDRGYVGPGQGVVISAGVPLGQPGGTNMLRVAWAPG